MPPVHRILCAIAICISNLVFGTALASPPSHNALGAHFNVLSRGPTNVIEIQLSPISVFDSVRVQAGSGISSLSPPCAFDGVVIGGSYRCTINVTHKPGTSSLSLNVVGERIIDPAKPKVVEVNHFTLPNLQFKPHAAKRTSKATPNLVLTPAPGAAKQQR